MLESTVDKLVKEDNRLRPEDKPVHDWYRFVLSYPPHLVRQYVDKFELNEHSCLLDPFCGTGTTLVEAKKLGIASIGFEANHFAQFASQTKTTWDISTEKLLSHSEEVADVVTKRLRKQGLFDLAEMASIGNTDIKVPQVKSLPEESQRLLLENSISPIPLHKFLVLLEVLDRNWVHQLAAHQRLALGKAAVSDCSNLHFGPEVGVSRIKRTDAPVVEAWLNRTRKMASDLEGLQSKVGVPADVYCADSRKTSDFLLPETIDAVITSPPYPNEKDYTRTTRLESVLLGFIRNREDLRALKSGLIRSNTRNVFKLDDDDQMVSANREIQAIATEIEKRRIELGKTSGFERLYSRVTTLYFGGMARHLSDLRTSLRSGARLAYVVGDQASYLRVMIRTGTILARIAETLGYQVESIDLFRTRLATATKEQLREEVVVLKWPGKRKSP